jgi:hypothetical protein
VRGCVMLRLAACSAWRAIQGPAHNGLHFIKRGAKVPGWAFAGFQALALSS